MAREDLFRELPSAKVVLLALPVQVGALPNDTFFSFSSEADSLSSNRLYLQEIYGMEKPVGLYILPSSMPGSLGDATWLPLLEALRYSRGRSVLFHRWAAVGKPSAEIARNFLDHWPANGGAPQCLQAARLKYLARQGKRPEMAHPHYWAGYLAYGLPEAPITPAGIPRFWIIAAVGGLILIGWLVRLH
jgi:CHAT domain-containing protein